MDATLALACGQVPGVMSNAERTTVLGDTPGLYDALPVAERITSAPAVETVCWLG